LTSGGPCAHPWGPRGTPTGMLKERKRESEKKRNERNGNISDKIHDTSRRGFYQRLTIHYLMLFVYFILLLLLPPIIIIQLTSDDKDEIV